MAKEVGSRELAAAGGVASNKALDELLKKKALLAEADQAKSEQQNEGEQAASSEQAAPADGQQVAAAEGASIFADGQSYEVASAGAVAADGGAGGLPTNTLLIAGGAALVGGAALALSSDDDGDTEVINNPGGGNGKVDDPSAGNDAPVIIVENGNGHVLENTNAPAYIFSAIDPDNQVNQTSKLVLGGTDAAFFNLSADGVLSFKANPDFEAAHGPAYIITITAPDAEGDAAKSSTKTFTILVDNDTTSPGEQPGGPTEGADTFTLSDNDVGQNGPDNVDGKGGDDVFNGAVGDLDDQDNLNGGAGNDTLNVSIGNGEDETPTLTSIETINVESRGPGANSLNLFNATGVTTVNVVDNGDDNGALNIKNVDAATTLIGLKGDQDVSVTLKNSAGTNDLLTTKLNGFTGDLVLGNAIERLSINAATASNFGLKDVGGTLNTVTVTGAADTTLTSYGATTYDYTAATGDSTLIFAAPNADAATVLFGAGDDVVDFGSFIKAVSDGTADEVSGGAGFDVLYADLNTGITVQPIVSGVEKISLAFLAGGPAVDAEFDASDVDDAPVLEIRDSSAYVNVNDLEAGTDIDIVGDIDNGGEGATFDFRSGSKAVTTVSFVTVSKEATDLVLTGDLEVSDVADLTVRVGENGSSPDNVGDGSALTGGEVEITGSIALDNKVTTALTIGTTEEDDDDIDNDGDLTVHGTKFSLNIVDLLGNVQVNPLGSAITQSDKLEDLTISGLNGNIFLGDGVISETADYAISDATNLRSLNVLADNATVSLGHIGFSNGAGALVQKLIGLVGNEDQASNLEEVNIVGANRGLFNLDDIYAGDLLGDPDDELLNGLLGVDLPVSLTLNGAIIEEFNVSTAARSETKSTFQEDSTPFGFNQIEDTVANAIEDLRIDVASDGRLMWGDIYSNLVEVTITGSGRLDLFNNNSGGDASSIDIYDEDDGAYLSDDDVGLVVDEEGVLPTINEYFALYFVRDIDATGHSGPLELDFRTFVGTNLNINGNLLAGLDIALVNAVQQGLFDGQSEVDATIRIGNQNLVDNGIRFDSYGIIGFLVSQSGTTLPIDLDLDGASVTVIAGNGNHLFTPSSGDNFLNGAVDPAQTDLGIPLYGLNLLDQTYGIVTGFGDDSVTTGSGSSSIYTGVGADEISAGAGADLVRGGFGQDTIDLGDDNASDHVVFVGQWLDGAEEESGETLDDNFDRILNFDSGEDVVELWNFIDLTADTTLAPVALTHWNITSPDDATQDFINSVNAPASVIIEFTGEYLNGDLKSAVVEDELLESQVVADFFNDIEPDAPFFAIFWDEGQDDAALFFIDGSGAPIVAEDVSLVAVFENVPENGFGFGDFQIGYVA